GFPGNIVRPPRALPGGSLCQRRTGSTREPPAPPTAGCRRCRRERAFVRSLTFVPSLQYAVFSLQFRSGADNWELAIDNSSIISISKLAGGPPSDLDQRFSPIDSSLPPWLEDGRRVDTVLY